MRYIYSVNNFYMTTAATKTKSTQANDNYITELISYIWYLSTSLIFIFISYATNSVILK